MKPPTVLCASALLLTAVLTSNAATLGSTVWNDLNQNGIQETNEPGLTNITVQLFDCTNTNLVTSVQTTNGGFFSFEGNTFPSNVFLRVVLPPGYLISPRDAGTNDNTDSDFDPITGSTHCFIINCTNATSTNCIQTNWGVGLFQAVPGVRGPGYWKTHPGAWPVTNIVIAGTNYASSNAWQLFANGPDKSLTLFRQLLAALLNEAAGADTSCITQELADAEAWLEDFPVGSNVRGSSDAWKLAAPIVETLEDYNEGRLCAPADTDDDDNNNGGQPPVVKPPKNNIPRGHGTNNPPGNAFGRLKRVQRPAETVFTIQTSSNMVNWVNLTTVTNQSGITDFFEDFDQDTNLVYRVVTIASEGAEPVNFYRNPTETGSSGNTELLPIVYEGDLVVRGNNNEVSGADDGGTVITGNLIVLGSKNTVSDLSVLGDVILRGNRNTLENVEYEGDVQEKGKGNEF